MPPFTALALNVTEAPAQIVVPDAVIVIEGVTGAFTVIVIAFEVSLDWVLQEALVVSIQLTTSLLFKTEVLNVPLFVPAGVAFTYH